MFYLSPPTIFMCLCIVLISYSPKVFAVSLQGFETKFSVSLFQRCRFPLLPLSCQEHTWWVGLWHAGSSFMAASSVCSMQEQEVVLEVVEVVFKENSVKLMPSAAECHRLIMILQIRQFLTTHLSIL